MKALLLASVLVIALLGCNKPQKPPLSIGEVKALICGSYRGEYNDGKEYIEIRPDNTFSQEFIQRGVTNFASGGKWSFEKLADRYLVTLEPFMNLRDALVANWQTGTNQGKGPKKTMFTATFYEDEPRIYFDRDMFYFITKKGTKMATIEPRNEFARNILESRNTCFSKRQMNL